MTEIPNQWRKFVAHVLQSLGPGFGALPNFPQGLRFSKSGSGVLLILGQHPGSRSFNPCVILTKRSAWVKQAGDLCCPGGSISPHLDAFFAGLLVLPFFPLGRWPFWEQWRVRGAAQSRRLALLLATSLRESCEEMRLMPWRVTFLGPLPAQRLSLFKREIYPMTAWVSGQKRFVMNREVEKIVYLPLADLLNPERYGRYRIHMDYQPADRLLSPHSGDLGCFWHQDGDEIELLWGATYRIVAVFLKRVFDFTPPPLISLPFFRKVLNSAYINGRF